MPLTMELGGQGVEGTETAESRAHWTSEIQVHRENLSQKEGGRAIDKDL